MNDISIDQMRHELMSSRPDGYASGGPVMGINVASDRKAGVRYADLIVDGHKTLESRNSDTLRPYVGKRVAIVRTGEGPAKAIGEVTIGEPLVVGKKEFRSLEDKHHVPEGSAFDITTPTKHLYPMHNPVRYEKERDVGHGIVSRKVVHAAKGGRIKEPKKTVKAYKLFRVHKDHPGKLFPLFVDANTPVEMGKWVDAKEGEMKDGKVKSKIGSLAYRPGWHAGDLPIATHIGEKSDSSLTAPDRRPANHAWAEVEMPDDVDWQTEANKRGTNAQGKLVPVKAHITDQIPHGGHYRYKTNPNMTGNWLIGGSMKVNRVLTDKEVERINNAAGLSDLPRAEPFKKKEFGFAGGGSVGPDEWMAEEHVNYPQRKASGGTPSLAEMKLALATGGQPDVNKVGFFNPVEKAALSLNRKRGAGNAFISDLKKTPGVNDQRLSELGLDDLATQPNVNQEDIVQRVQQKRIPLQETVRYPYEEDSEYSNTKSGLEQSVSYYMSGIKQMQDNIDRVSQTAPGSPMIDEFRRKMALMQKSLADTKERLLLAQPALYGPDTHPELNTEGGQNYRELLMTLPAQVDTTGFNVTGEGNRWYLRDKNNKVIEAFPSEQEAQSKLESRAQALQKNIYKSSHWNHPNVLLHLRMADHGDRDGKRGLLIDELQSDWHQQGAKIGYGKDLKVTDEAMRDHFNMDRDEWENLPDWVYQQFRNEYRQQVKEGVPEAPFKDNWHQLGLKRAIKEAADNGMKRLYLATGETQTQRYSEDQRKGMEHWYDNVYKNFLDKYARQHGGKIGQTQLANGDLVHYIDIVPSMVEAVKKGQSYEYGGVVHKADGGIVNQGGVMPTLAEMRMALMQQNPIALKNVGVNEATELDRKVYMPPNLSAGVMHAGGVDMSHEVPGQQMMPALPGTAPGQPGVPGQPPQGGPEGQMPGAQPSPMPTGFGNPPGPNAFPPSGPLPQPPSNILSMLPQGRALNAMQPTKLPTLARGGQPKFAIAPPVEKAKEPDEFTPYDRENPSVPSLSRAFDEAIKHHLSLSPEDRAKNSVRAAERVGDIIGRTSTGKVKDLLGKNAKLIKSEKGNEEAIKLPDGRGVETTGLALAPAYREGKFDTCPNHHSCKEECLGKTSGNYFKLGGGQDLSEFKGPRLNSLKKTHAFLHDPHAFAVKLHDEIEDAKAIAAQNGNHLGVRLNVLSDINPRVHKAIIHAHPDVTFYDYTKNNTDPIASNHHYTYSSTGVSQPGVENDHTNWKSMRRRLDNGDNVAMAFSHKEHLPEHVHDQETGKKYKVVNGDTHDFRPLDLQPEGADGVIVGLKNKKATGKMNEAHIDSKGFFVHYDPQLKMATSKSTGAPIYARDTNGSTIPQNKAVNIQSQAHKMIPISNDDGEKV